ncbi:MAG TPA: MobF family relaxase [Acidimicrobiales bacterium]|nr:MobF family relaxase [Acidimicrobiales bacterium]
MLGVHRLAAGGIGYYLADLTDDLPLPRGGAAGWIGRSAANMGLDGPVDPRSLDALLHGQHPRTGHALRSPRASVHGLDLTFTVPKSISVLFALGGDGVAHHVLDAQRAGVLGAITYLEEHALGAPRGSGDDRRILPTTGAVGAAFTHYVSRNHDPHVHTHVVMANLVQGVDGRWGACDGRGVWAHRQAASAVYDAGVRAELSRRLGIGWTATHGAPVEVDGVSPHLLGEFSSRGADVRRHMAQWGARSARGARVAWAATRPDKPRAEEFAALTAQWVRRASSLGLEGPVRGSIPRAGAPREQVVDEHRFLSTLSGAPDGAARRRDLVASFGVAAVDGATADTLARVTDLWIPPHPAHDVGVAERVHPLASLVPGSHLLRELGPRPLDPVAHAIWREAAKGIEDYRTRWRVSPESFSSARGSTLPVHQLIDRLETDHRVREARLQLGWRAPPVLEMDRGR